ncbi:hypothetical protein BCV69DRAFT_309917 [Microstroma glucosiphilum]|uniref:Uncharacterized protein n=1 Tax=Pseudomicrostroma glucosiphilum TaxID=1684307 RepID=A0A316UFP3_9BASI|nr:hypothetical protein BCV69DRAFT_309917 [Pseudomicrostroma glucosiphilum]PWN24069.1 hypothetical protein BCV69DRAFT_309917 [Pseudomicrostroma glucosiphilum]
MDSLRILRDSLDSSRPPPAGPTKRYDKTLNSDFKAAALHLTNLYRNSIASSQSTYRSGYVQGLRDMLDLVVLRSVQAQPPSSSSGSGAAGSHQQGASSSDLGRLLGDSAAEGGVGTAFDDDAEGDGLRSPSYKELRWLARYLRARIEAIKSESDDEDAEGQEGDQHPQASGSGTREESSYQQRSVHTSLPAASVRTRESSARSQLSNEPEERATSSSVAYSPSSAAPETPVTRFQRPVPTGRTPRQSAPPSSYTAPQGQPQVQGRISAPSTSAFSFSMPPSPSSSFGNSSNFQSAATALTATAASQPHPRRRARGSHGSSPSSGFASGSSPSTRAAESNHNNSNVVGSNTALLSPVGEEAPSSTTGSALALAQAQALVEEEMEDVREERPNGRRGPLVSSGAVGRGGAMAELDGQRPKRRRKTANDKFAVSTRTGGGGGGGGIGGLGIAIGGAGAGGGVGGGLGSGQTLGLGSAPGQSQSSASGLSQEESDSALLYFLNIM